MTMVLANYVKLEPEKEKELRFVRGSWAVVPHTWRDPKTGRLKTGRRLSLDVLEEDYLPVSKGFSTLSEKLAARLEIAHLNGDLYRYRVGIKWTPNDLATEYQVRYF